MTPRWREPSDATPRVPGAWGGSSLKGEGEGNRPDRGFCWQKTYNALSSRRSDVGVVYRAGFENQCGVSHRGFESLSLRQFWPGRDHPPKLDLGNGRIPFKNQQCSKARAERRHRATQRTSSYVRPATASRRPFSNSRWFFFHASICRMMPVFSKRRIDVVALTLSMNA